MDIYLRKINDSLHPASQEDKDKLYTIKRGDVCKVKLTTPRNYENHKRFFALMKLIFENQDKYPNLESMRSEIIMRTGRFTAHTHLSGSISYHAKSMAFDKMEEDEFKSLFSDSIDVALKHFCSNMTEDQLWEVARFG